MGTSHILNGVQIMPYFELTGWDHQSIKRGAARALRVDPPKCGGSAIRIMRQ